MKTTFLFLVSFFVLVTYAQEQKNPVPQISVSGEGKVNVVPDQAVINLGFQNSGKDAKEVKKLNDEVIDKVIKFLKKSNIPASDYKTNNVYLYKSYDYDKKAYNYQANQSLSLTLKDLKKYDEIMMGLNEAGVNSIQGVEFKSSKREVYESEARKKAMLNAKQKATDYVSAIGQKIGKALLISDSSQTHYPQPMYKTNMATMAEDGASRETLAVGEIIITATVNVTFALE